MTLNNEAGIQLFELIFWLGVLLRRWLTIGVVIVISRCPGQFLGDYFCAAEDIMSCVVTEDMDPALENQQVYKESLFKLQSPEARDLVPYSDLLIAVVLVPTQYLLLSHSSVFGARSTIQYVCLETLLIN